MTAKSFFKKVGRGLQHASGDFTNAVGKGAGMVIGTAAGKAAEAEYAEKAGFCHGLRFLHTQEKRKIRRIHNGKPYP